MAPIEAKNYQCKMGFRGFETRKLGKFEAFLYNVRGFKAKKQAVQLHWLHWLEWRPC